jgi:predicted nucleic acid-binding protein
LTVFADSSALVKLYADEAGHETVRAVPTMVVSALARAEVVAAIWRKQRMRELAGEDARVLTAAFEFDYYGDEQATPRFVVIDVVDDVLEEAALVAARHGLRAYDAVQLASALTARVVASEIDTMLAFDIQLRGAAAAEGWALLPESLS